MSCSKFETDIALYAGGDLPAGRIARIESHLVECAGCRALAAELRAGRALLGELRDDPLEDAMLAAVRRNVLRQLWGRPSACGGLSGRPYWKLALAAALVLAVVLAWPRHPPAKEVLVPRGAAPRAAAASHAAPSVVPVARRVRRRHRTTPAAQPGPPLLVQFVTDDPNIVIYWLVDQKPQGD